MRPLGRGFGVVLGLLGRSWDPLGRLGRVLGASWERLGASWKGIRKKTSKTSSKRSQHKNLS